MLALEGHKLDDRLGRRLEALAPVPPSQAGDEHLHAGLQDGPRRRVKASVDQQVGVELTHQLPGSTSEALGDDGRRPRLRQLGASGPKPEVPDPDIELAPLQL